MGTNWWLAEVSEHGYAMSLEDGPHDGHEGVEHALFLYEQLGFAKGRKFCGVKVEEFLVTARDQNAQ